MSLDNLSPSFYARSAACRLLIICALSSIFIAIVAAQVAGQTSSSSSSARPVARLVSSSEPTVLPLPPQGSRWASTNPPADAAHGARREPVSMTVSSMERRAFELINAERAKNGEAPLVWDAELCRMAELHSQHMAQQNFFSHVGPDGMTVQNRALSLGLQNWTSLGENIAYNRGFDDPVVFAVQGWMHSEGHRANILNAGFNRSAIGVVQTPEGRVYLTQVFMAR